MPQLGIRHVCQVNVLIKRSRSKIMHSAVCAKVDTAQILVHAWATGTPRRRVPCRSLATALAIRGRSLPPTEQPHTTPEARPGDRLFLWTSEGAEDIVLETMSDIPFEIVLVEISRRSMPRVRNLLASANMTRAWPCPRSRKRKSETWIRGRSSWEHRQAGGARVGVA